MHFEIRTSPRCRRCFASAATSVRRRPIIPFDYRVARFPVHQLSHLVVMILPTSRGCLVPVLALLSVVSAAAVPGKTVLTPHGEKPESNVHLVPFGTSFFV